MKTKIRQLLAWVRQPVGLVFFVSLGFILVNLVVIHHFKAYSSDDVAWQSALLSWTPFSGDTYYSGSDPFFIKAPLYVLLQELFGASRRMLFLTSALFAVINFALFYYSVLYFMRKFKLQVTYRSLLPVVWLSSFGFFFSQLFLIPNSRNLELGAMFVMFVLAAKVYYGEINILKNLKTKLLAVLSAVVAGWLICNDLYFLYFGVGPLLLLSAYLWFNNKASRRQMQLVIGLLVLSVIVAKIVKTLYVAAGVSLATSAEAHFVTFEALFANIAAVLHSLFIIFGADFFGQAAASPYVLPLLCNAAILGVVLLLFRIVRHGKPTAPETVWQRFFVLLFIGVIVIASVSTITVGTSTYRYLVVLPYIAVLLLVLVRIPNKRASVVVSGLLLAGIALNMGSMVLRPLEMIPGPLVNKGNAENYRLLQALERHNVTKGYGQYWDSTINTYLSDGKVTVVPVVCTNEKTRPIKWLVAESQIEKKVSKSFIVYNPLYADQGMCNPDQLKRQFGTPSKEFKIDSNTVLIYECDIL